MAEMMRMAVGKAGADSGLVRFSAPGARLVGALEGAGEAGAEGVHTGANGARWRFGAWFVGRLGAWFGARLDARLGAIRSARPRTPRGAAANVATATR